MKTYDLVVASHLRWNFVWQRPQQLLSRLAKHHRILFIEEPIFAPEGTTDFAAIVREVAPNIVTLTPQIPEAECGGESIWLWPCRDLITAQVRESLKMLGFRHRVLWFYTPTPDFLVETVEPEITVYDVMDELANFKFAPEGQREREQRLISEAAVVFTGGASLYNAKKHLNSNTHLFASGVDSRHYEKACDPETTLPAWMESIPSPRASYIGVIDERLDYKIVEAMAAAHPNIQFLMCGPIVKVNIDDLPKGPNLHYPGQQNYDDLPRILAGTDVCLMPFAMNEATKYISPTKTLEYMATHRPIVSTPIRDVEHFYSDIVYLAGSADEFAAQIDAALKEPAEVRARKRRREDKVLTEQAWDAIADNMKTLMDREWNRTSTAKSLAQASSPVPRPGVKSAQPPVSPGVVKTGASMPVMGAE